MTGKNAKIFTRAIALILALIMLGGVMVAAIQAFALDYAGISLEIANTGDNNVKAIMIVVTVVAAAVLLLMLILPKIFKNR